MSPLDCYGVYRCGVNEPMTSIEQEFLSRVSRIPHQGMGLSVDVYAPDVFELVAALDAARLQYEYLEIFKASRSALDDVRRRVSRAHLQYHAEGVWATQPRLEASRQFDTAVTTAAMHLAVLGSHWMNHECASKQMAGYSFGTYLPPLFTRAGADLTAEHAMLIQQRLATSGYFLPDREPLLLLEIPPLTYFGFGDLSVAGFFHRVATQASCGLVLDIGHVWTIYRYSGEWRRRSLLEFLIQFLDEFPLERVVQIHIAGLNVHEAINGISSDQHEMNRPASGYPPLWIDAHSAPIPEVLWDSLAQVLAHPRLVHLKGIALEVDTKPTHQIVTEFERFQVRFRDWHNRLHPGAPVEKVFDLHKPEQADPVETHDLERQYKGYAQIVTNRSIAAPNAGAFVGLPLLGQDHDTLDIYRRQFLPHEILEWGGNLRDMFPQTCRALDHHGVPLSTFVDYWFREARCHHGDFDFFLLKIDRFVEFVREMMPESIDMALLEAHELRDAYRTACEESPIGVRP